MIPSKPMSLKQAHTHRAGDWNSVLEISNALKIAAGPGREKSDDGDVESHRDGITTGAKPGGIEIGHGCGR